jgi:hypothetical protein
MDESLKRFGIKETKTVDMRSFGQQLFEQYYTDYEPFIPCELKRVRFNLDMLDMADILIQGPTHPQWPVANEFEQMTRNRNCKAAFFKGRVHSKGGENTAGILKILTVKFESEIKKHLPEKQKNQQLTQEQKAIATKSATLMANFYHSNSKHTPNATTEDVVRPSMEKDQEDGKNDFAFNCSWLKEYAATKPPPCGPAALLVELNKARQAKCLAPYSPYASDKQKWASFVSHIAKNQQEFSVRYKPPPNALFTFSAPPQQDKAQQTITTLSNEAEHWLSEYFKSYKKPTTLEQLLDIHYEETAEGHTTKERLKSKEFYKEFGFLTNATPIHKPKNETEWNKQVKEFLSSKGLKKKGDHYLKLKRKIHDGPAELATLNLFGILKRLASLKQAPVEVPTPPPAPATNTDVPAVEAPSSFRVYNWQLQRHLVPLVRLLFTLIQADLAAPFKSAEDAKQLTEEERTNIKWFLELLRKKYTGGVMEYTDNTFAEILGPVNHSYYPEWIDSSSLAKTAAFFKHCVTGPYNIGAWGVVFPDPRVFPAVYGVEEDKKETIPETKGHEEEEQPEQEKKQETAWVPEQQKQLEPPVNPTELPPIRLKPIEQRMSYQEAIILGFDEEELQKIEEFEKQNKTASKAPEEAKPQENGNKRKSESDAQSKPKKRKKAQTTTTKSKMTSHAKKFQELVSQHFKEQNPQRKVRLMDDLKKHVTQGLNYLVAGYTDLFEAVDQRESYLTYDLLVTGLKEVDDHIVAHLEEIAQKNTLTGLQACVASLKKRIFMD